MPDKTRAKLVLAGDAVADAMAPLISEQGIVSVFFMAMVNVDGELFPVSAAHGLDHAALQTVMVTAKQFLDGDMPNVDAVVTVRERPRKN